MSTGMVRTMRGQGWNNDLMGPDADLATFAATVQPHAYPGCRGMGRGLSVLIQLIIICLEICQTHECIPKFLNTNKKKSCPLHLCRTCNTREEGKGDPQWAELTSPPKTQRGDSKRNELQLRESESVNHSVLSDSFVTPTLLCPWDSPGKNTGVDCHALLQGIFPTLGLLHCWQILYCLSHQGIPYGKAALNGIF